MDEDAAGLPAARPGPPLRPGPGRCRLRPGPGLDVVNVTKIASMLEKATENASQPPPRAVAAAARFARDPAEYRATQLTLIPGEKDGTP